ncbi:MAG: hypothetical protein AAF648_00585 [Pseudomonadota bacterium]
MTSPSSGALNSARISKLSDDSRHSGPTSGSSPDWRIWLGILLTAAWLLLGMNYVSANIGWDNFNQLPADELGSFLEGAFAPLAFLWLVIGYFLQQRELQQNSAALRAQAEEIQRTAEQAVIQSDKMSQTEMHARQQAFLTIAESVAQQLGTISGMLFLSSQAADEAGVVTQDEVNQLFTIRASQDNAVFSRRLLQLGNELSEQDGYALFYGTPIRARHSNHFVFAFERMMRRASELETEEMIRDTLLATAHAFLYSRIKRHQANAPAELADHAVTGLHFNM